MRRPRLHPHFESSKGTPDYQALDDELQALREGTREQFESSWTWVAASVTGESGSVTFTHHLGEVPWAVDVIFSENASGKTPQVPDSANYTVAKTNTTITLQNDSTDAGYYFKVRAL
jgi:hypothetical protein